MIHFQDKDISGIHHHTKDGIHREITAVYYRESLLWELMKGYLFSKDGYALQSKDGFILKAKDQ